jgi:pimeloyl-ACP methyl ester carboxylesterase
MENNWRLDPEKYRGKMWEYYPDRYIQVKGVRTRYWDEGKGKDTIVMVHGYTGSVEEFAWNIPFLKKKYRVVALDLPGFGLTGKPDADYTYDYYASYVNDFMQAMRIPSAHIMGHSMGGAVSLAISLRHPDRVKSLALVSPVFGKKFQFALHLVSVPFVGEKLLKPAASKEEVQAAFRHLTHDFCRYADITLKRNLRFQNEPGYIRVSLKYIRNYMTLTGFTGKARKMFKYYDKNLPQMKIPVFLTWGHQDQIVPFSASKELLPLIPHAEFWDPDPCGHCALWEYPVEFNAKTLDFLKRVG